MKKTPDQRLADHKILLKRVMGGALVVLLLVNASYFLMFHSTFSRHQENWGQFGDFIGGVLNPFFALCALFALLYTIVLQVEEMQDMRAEFTKTVDAAKHQTFESTFFNLLRLHNENVAVIALEQEKVDPGSNRLRKYVHHGRTALYHYATLVKDRIESEPEFEELEPLPDDPVKNIRNGYTKFFDNFGPVLGNYFVTIHEILFLVDQSALDIDKAMYGRILRSQLASWEALLLAYYCIADQQLSPTMARMVNEYSLLEFLEPHPFQMIEELKFFESGAFGSS